MNPNNLFIGACISSSSLLEKLAFVQYGIPLFLG
jgi:hypothetical protein